MVGLVIVSHSARLAEGVAELARSVGGAGLALAATGGLDLPGQPLGTDAMLVLRAIEQVYSDDGVLVLMDLGSAVLSAELALDLLPPERRAHVALCEAPLVEGAVAAAVQARLGRPLAQVMAEARSALSAKAAHLGPAGRPPNESRPSPPVKASRGSTRERSGPTEELRLTLRNRFGLHARPAARFVQAASRFPGTDLSVTNLTADRGPVNAKSINSLITLGVWQGHEILITASGADTQRALAALASLADEDFEDIEPLAEAETRPAPALAPAAPAPHERTHAGAQVNAQAGAKVGAKHASPLQPLQGLAVSPGVAIGPAHIHRIAEMPDVATRAAADPEAEWNGLQAALEQTRTQIRATRDATAARLGRAAAAIFEAHLLFLQDEALIGPARHAILENRTNAAAAWQESVSRMAAEYAALEDVYLASRAADLTDVGRQVLVNLPASFDYTMPPKLPGGSVPLRTLEDSRTGAQSKEAGAPGILIARDLTPAEAAHLDLETVLGICTGWGGTTSHAAILARTLGVPYVAGLGAAMLAVAEETTIIMDGGTGQVWPDPPSELLAEYAARGEAERAARTAERAAGAEPAVTRDGRRVEVAANIGSIQDAQAAVAFGADGVGLFRTEFLFADRRTAPGEEEQLVAYRTASEALGGRPLIIRTLDAGGDKPLPYLDMPAEANPFLGWRAIRLCLAQPELFKTQLRAILRVAAERPVKVMFPMIATLAEWRGAVALLAAARDEVLARGDRAPASIETGIMVEIPAAALLARAFAAEVDFFSIGTNDLMQYTLAAERGNARLTDLVDPLQPAVLRLIRDVVDAAHRRGKWAGICGELAADPLAIPLLAGLGVDELSMHAPAIPRAKQVIRELDYAAARGLAETALGQDSAEGVRRVLT